MNLHNNDTAFDNSNTSDRYSPMSQRLLALTLMAIPCLMIVFGLLIDMFLVPNTNATYWLIVIIPTALILLSRSLSKNNSSDLRAASRWTLKSYQESIAGLDERERQVIDQAYRMSYRILAWICWLAIAAAFSNIYIWHFTYHLGQIGIVFIMFGIIDLVSYLPTAIVIWKEEA